MSVKSNEKHDIASAVEPVDKRSIQDVPIDDGEVFRAHVGEGQTNYRTVGWIKAAFLMLKVIFSIGILSIPSMMAILGAVPGAILCVAWTLVNTYGAFVQGHFRNSYPGIHTVADIGYTIGGPVLREIVGIQYIIAYAMVAANGVLSCAISINAMGYHPGCTLIWSAICTIACVMVACLPKFAQIGFLTWIGCALVIVSVLIITIAVGVQGSNGGRPFSAPQTGPFDLGFVAVNNPDFVLGMTASNVLFVSSAGTSSFLPVMAEMKNPRDYKKAIALGMFFTTAAYVILSEIIYAKAGVWITSPSLGSAGPTIRTVCYALAFPSLLITTILVIHITAKYIFVRALRGTSHLETKTKLHYTVWFGACTAVGIFAFILASAIPFFNELLGLIGSFCFAPLALMLPAAAWLFQFGKAYWHNGGIVQKSYVVLNVLLFLLGVFVFGPGTYTSVQGIINAYDAGTVGSAFSCADNSGVTA